LSEALGSVLAQSFQDWECIIVNDGSPDHTATVAQEWIQKDPRFRIIEKPNGGISSARNSGLLEARGEYIQFLDADDLIESRKFAWQENILQTNPDFGIVYGDVRYFRTGAPEERRFTLFDPDEPWLEPAWLDERSMVEKLLHANIMGIHCPMIRRSVINNIGLFDETLNHMEDWYYWLRCAAAGTVFHFAPASDTLALVRIHPESASQDRDPMWSGMFEMTVRAGNILKDPELRRKNFDLGVARMRASNRGSIDHQLLRLAWGNRGINIIRPFLSTYLSRHPRMAKVLWFLN